MVRAVKDADLGTIMQWFRDHTGTQLNSMVLSRTGFIYEGVAALFLFSPADSDVAMTGWPISNPLSSKAERDVAFAELIEAVEKLARVRGFKILTTYSSVPQVARRFEEWGYSVGDNPVTQYVKYIGGT